MDKSFYELDDEALQKTLQDVPHLAHYYEAVLQADEELPDTFTASVFPAVRVLLTTSCFSIVRLYFGREASTPEQQVAVMTAYHRGHIVAYRRAGLPTTGKDKTDE